MTHKPCTAHYMPTVCAHSLLITYTLCKILQENFCSTYATYCLKQLHHGPSMCTLPSVLNAYCVHPTYSTYSIKNTSVQLLVQKTVQHLQNTKPCKTWFAVCHLWVLFLLHKRHQQAMIIAASWLSFGKSTKQSRRWTEEPPGPYVFESQSRSADLG